MQQYLWGFLSSVLLNCFFVLLLQVALLLFDDHIKKNPQQIPYFSY